MQKIIFSTCIILFCIINSYSQEMEKDINLVISIDGKVPISIANAKIIIKENSNKSEQIEVGYIPGELSLDITDFERVMQQQESALFLSFEYYEYEKEQQKVYCYEIELKRFWFEQSFRVLRIYNLNKKENKKVFYPLEGKDYTYEIDLPSNSITRIRKK